MSELLLLCGVLLEAGRCQLLSVDRALLLLREVLMLMMRLVILIQLAMVLARGNQVACCGLIGDSCSGGCGT